MFDLVIRNALLVSGQESRPATIAIAGERIAAVEPPGIDLSGREEVDADGRIIMPGLIDAHVHIPGYALDTRLDDFETATRAAAAGGVTTVLLMPTDDPRTASVAYFKLKQRRGAGRAYVDFGIQALLGPRQTDIADLAALGAVSFEMFLAYGGNPAFVVGNDDYELLRLMAMVRDVDGIVGVTPHSPSLIQTKTALGQEEAHHSYHALAAARPPVSERLGIARACVAAQETGARMHLRAISTAQSLDLIERFRSAADLTSEVMSHHLLFTAQDVDRLGPYGIIIPPLRDEADRAAMRQAVLDASVDMVVSDHSPLLKADKGLGALDVWRTPPGMPGVQTLLASLLHLVAESHLSYQAIVASLCERPARRFGLHPRKGTIAVGSDADLLILDPRTSREIRDDDQLSKARYSTLAGTRVFGSLDAVYLRGQRIAENEAVLGAPRGRFVARG